LRAIARWTPSQRTAQKRNKARFRTARGAGSFVCKQGAAPAHRLNTDINPHILAMIARKSPKQTSPEERLRRCLTCGAKFMSAWAGNRVCKKCQSSALWKQGC